MFVERNSPRSPVRLRSAAGQLGVSPGSEASVLGLARCLEGRLRVVVSKLFGRGCLELESRLGLMVLDARRNRDGRCVNCGGDRIGCIIV